MSDSPPPDVASDAAGAGVPALTAEAIAAILEDFRRWLTDAAASGAATEPPAAAPDVDLSTLVGQFTALRHEVHLQTRAVRAQQEQNAETLRHLADALDALAQAPAAPPPLFDASAEERLRPLLKSLVDLYDSVALAGRELQRAPDAVSAALRPVEEAAVEDRKEKDAPTRPSWWARLLGARPSDPARQERWQIARDAIERTRQTLEATAAGYAMTLQRVERTMMQHGLEPIPAVGRPFDPDRMEALEVVLDSGRPSGEVVEEVRRGYLWQGRIFRYAQVRVAKSG